MAQSTKGLKSNQSITMSAKGLSYSPSAKSAANNARTWSAIKLALSKGPQTVGSLTTLVTQEFNHASFVGYAIRRGWLNVGEAVATPAPAAKKPAAKKPAAKKPATRKAKAA